ncbi:MAG TPA: cation acetate symporter, partial [Aestuariivirga sp.]|nr:cation acetate symporter [Aestuariivirga sp.]
TLAGASAVSHDLYASVFAKGTVNEAKEIRISKIAAVVIGLIAIGLGYVFENINVAFMVGLAFAVAASTNFPILVMSTFWKGMTTKGAVIGGILGLISSVGLTILSPGVWEAVLGYEKGSAPFPYANPALFSMALAFLGIWIGSMIDGSKRGQIDKAGFDDQYVRSETGIGAAGAVSH